MSRPTSIKLPAPILSLDRHHFSTIQLNPEVALRGVAVDNHHILPVTALNPEVTLEVDNSVVIIGANGSGKTRLGVWFEFESSQQSSVRRIAAQKSLEFPNSVSPFALQDAAVALEMGVDVQQFSDNRQGYLNNFSGNKRGSKWGNKPETKLVHDYKQLLVYLIS